MTRREFMAGMLAAGTPEWDSEILDGFHLGDPRAYDIIYEFPGHTMTGWKRPWVKFNVLAGYPVEFRVYVEHDAIVGVSNYYPQRALPETWEYRESVRLVIMLTWRLLASMPIPLRYPGWGFQDWSPDKKNFTADFAQTEEGTVVFLEGGPPFGRYGAHPCCFPVDHPWGDATHLRIEGVPVIMANAGGEE